MSLSNNVGEERSELTAQSVGAPAPGLCQAECHRFRAWTVPVTFYQYQSSRTISVRSLILSEQINEERITLNKGLTTFGTRIRLLSFVSNDYVDFMTD